MKRKQINTQMSNFRTYEMYKRKYLTLAENVYQFKNLPDYIDIAFLNKNLLYKGSIAFFVDEELGLLALPYTVLGNRDVYDRPIKIEVYGENGYTRVLNKDEFVIMYDNNARYPIYIDVLQYAERIAHSTRVSDINISQQRTPRIIKVKNNKEQTLKGIMNKIDSFEDVVMGYDSIDIDDIDTVLAPAPFVADKVDLHKEKLYNEFLTLIGVSNVAYEKKERQIKDEINAQMGGTIASRFSRFEPREKAVDEINKKWGYNIKVYYYDGIPESRTDTNKGGDINDLQ